MEYPFDSETTAFAHVSAKYTNGFGHLHLDMRLPSLSRTGSLDSVRLLLTNQCSNGDWRANEPEPFYAIRLTASEWSEGLDVRNVDRVAKVSRQILKAVEKLDAAVGAPAVLLEDLMMRYIRAAKVTHVYVADGTRDQRSIPDCPLYLADRFDRLHDEIARQKRALLMQCGAIRQAA